MQIHNKEFWSILKTFKIWKYDSKNDKNKVLEIINYNKYCHFINPKNLYNARFNGLKSYLGIIST